MSNDTERLELAYLYHETDVFDCFYMFTIVEINSDCFGTNLMRIEKIEK